MVMGYVSLRVQVDGYLLFANIVPFTKKDRPVDIRNQ